MELDIHSMIHDLEQHLSGVQTEVMTPVVLDGSQPCKLCMLDPIRCCMMTASVC